MTDHPPNRTCQRPCCELSPIASIAPPEPRSRNVFATIARAVIAGLVGWGLLVWLSGCLSVASLLAGCATTSQTHAACRQVTQRAGLSLEERRTVCRSVELLP
jgi:ABC-type uncharacterized transport system permease subunit